MQRSDIVESFGISPEKRKAHRRLARRTERLSKLWPVEAGWERAKIIGQNWRLSTSQMRKQDGGSHKFEKKEHGIFIRVGDEFWDFIQNHVKGLDKWQRGQVNREALVIGFAELSIREAQK